MALDMVPVSFIARETTLSWREAEFGHSRGWLGWRDAVELAVSAMQSGAQGPPELVELASVDKSTAWKSGELLKALAATEPELPRAAIEGKWLFIRLAWLYENLGSAEDPLGKVDWIAGAAEWRRNTTPRTRINCCRPGGPIEFSP
ncbi:MAG: DUF2247 family protein [Acidobacteriota bacterium]